MEKNSFIFTILIYFILRLFSFPNKNFKMQPYILELNKRLLFLLLEDDI